MPPASLKRSASDDAGSGGAEAPSASGGAAKRIKTEGVIGAGDGDGDGDGDGGSAKPSKAFTHVYLCIDRSGSMTNKDVAVGGNDDDDNKLYMGRSGSSKKSGGFNTTPSTDQCMTRYDAVFAAAAHLVQLQKGKGIDFSLILWNDEAEWMFRNRNANESLTLLTEAKTANPPRLGTNFSNCFKMLRECIVGVDTTTGTSNGIGKAKVKTETKSKPGTGSSSSSVVIFLSDGRPGDLRAAPPNAGEQIQPTYRRNKQEHESVGGHLGALGPHLPPGTLHFVGIHESGYPWLRWLAERYNGTFHQSMLHFGQVDNNGGGGGDEPGVGENLAGEEEAPAAMAAVGDALNGNGGDENEPGNQPAAAAEAAAANMAKEDIVDEQNLDIGGENGNNHEEEEEEEEADFDPNATNGNSDDDDGDDDDDLEFVEEVSANEMIRRNVANGEVINIASQSQSQSIMDTFSSLSQSISHFHESQYQSQGDDSYDEEEDSYADDL